MSDGGRYPYFRQVHEKLFDNIALRKGASKRFSRYYINHAAGVSKEGSIGGFMYQKQKLRWKILVEIQKAIYTKNYRGSRHRAARAP